MRQAPEIVIYTYRGRVERGSRYDWQDGYSATTLDGSVLYPWMTRRECQRDARQQRKRARFVRDGRPD